MNYDDLYQKFIGNDKIQPLLVKKGRKDDFILIYREGKKNHKIVCEDRNILDAILVEFGGRNPETCKTDSRFLQFDGTWGAEDLNELGHRVLKIYLRGNRQIRSKSIPIYMPAGTGHAGTIRANKQNEDVVRLHLVDKEHIDFTRSFNEPYELDALRDFIFSDGSLKDLTWFVRTLCTESREQEKQCVWKRVQAGDGTRQMVLELRELDGVPYEKCIRQDLFDAAGDMFDAPCKIINMTKKNTPSRKICLFAAEDGAVDISAYEAIH